MNQRKDYLDIAKGIGIILVVWAHADGSFSKYITQFHMPFFFFISGMLFNSRGGVKEYIKKKCKSLLIPFWGWNFLFYPVFYILYYWQGWEMHQLIKEVIEIFLTLNKVPFLGATWFLASLFWISIFVKASSVFLQKNKYCDGIFVAVSLGLCILGFTVTLPYRQSRTLICAFFYGVGYIYKKYIHEIKINKRWTVVAVFSLIIYIGIATVNDCIMGDNTYRYKSLFVTGALIATYFTIYFSRLLEDKKRNYFVRFVMYLGQNSFYIVIWHILAFRIAILIQIIILKANIKEIIDFPVFYIEHGWWIVYIITGILGSLVWKYILEHNFATKTLRKFYFIR